jgi:hypothetical protein
MKKVEQSETTNNRSDCDHSHGYIQKMFCRICKRCRVVVSYGH